MGGIRTSAAAELLGVSPSTLRTWERRLGFPEPRRTTGNHRHYELCEIESLREALAETGNISSAVALVRARGRGPTSPARLVRAFDSFDEVAADLELEESLALRSVERTVDELLLPAIELALGRAGREAELEHACRWATGWLHAARRIVAPATRPEGVLMLDSGSPLGLESLRVQALELFLRRAGLRVLLLSADLAEARLASALRALRPAAIVACGGSDPAARDGAMHRIRAAFEVHGLDYRGADPGGGRPGAQVLGDGPAVATAALVALFTHNAQVA